jgi:hypothetical protein
LIKDLGILNWVEKSDTNEYQKYCRIIEYPIVSRIYKFSVYKPFYISNIFLPPFYANLKMFVLATSNEQERENKQFSCEKRESKKVS